MTVGVFKVSERGQMALPAEARRRWNLSAGGSVEVVDLGGALLILPADRGGLRDTLRRAVESAGGYADLARRVGDEDPDLRVIGDVVVDDSLLFRILTGDEPDSLRPLGGRLATTGIYYHRLCRALVDRKVLGAMSRELDVLEPELAQAAIDAVTTLPDHVTLVSLRTLAMPMARLIDAGARLNLLALEALAAAEHLDAELCMDARDVNPRLVAAAEEREVLVRAVSD